MNNIKRISSYLLLIFNILIVTIPFFLTLHWICISDSSANIIHCFETLEIKTPEGWVNLNTVSWTPMLKLFGFCADLIGSLPFIISLFFLKRLFSYYKRGEIFTRKNALIYRKMGLLYLFDALFIKSLSQTLMILVITMTNPPGHRYLSISFGKPNLSSLFYAVLVIIVSWVMFEASKLYDENKLTI